MKIDKILNENNDMFMDLQRKKREHEKSKYTDIVDQEIRLSESLKQLKVKQI